MENKRSGRPIISRILHIFIVLVFFVSMTMITGCHHRRCGGHYHKNKGCCAEGKKDCVEMMKNKCAKACCCDDCAAGKHCPECKCAGPGCGR